MLLIVIAYRNIGPHSSVRLDDETFRNCAVFTHDGNADIGGCHSPANAAVRADRHPLIQYRPFDDTAAFNHTVRKQNGLAHDRPGLLYAITHTLSENGLSIARARISTEATRAIDSFYVRLDDAKLTVPEKLKSLREALEAKLA